MTQRDLLNFFQYPLLCPHASMPLLTPACYTEWKPPHALAQCTARVFLAAECASKYDVQIDLDVPHTISGHILFCTRYGQGCVILRACVLRVAEVVDLMGR